MIERADLFYGLWSAWGVYWAASALRAKRVRRREGWGSGGLHMAGLGVAGVLMALPSLPSPLGDRVIGDGFLPFAAGLLLTMAGLALTLWARKTLGGNWSAFVTVKDGHELVCRGPYRLVRHPIYTGLLAAFFGSALARGEWRGVLVVAVAFAALWFKLRTEERFMTETFGPDYERYRAEVAALIPYLL